MQMDRIMGIKSLYNGLGLEQGDKLAGLSNSLANLAAGNTDFENNFYNGQREYVQALEQERAAHPISSILTEMAGGALTGAGIGKLLQRGYGVVKALKHSKQVYPRRTREQWKADYEYGKEEFNKLRAQSPLKRDGHPDAIVTKKSWDKIKQGNIPEKYEMLQDVPDIYKTGEYHVQPRIKSRGDDFTSFHWFQKNNKGIQIGEGKEGRSLYNVNPNIRQYLLEHPDVAEKLGIDLSKQ